MANIQSKDDLLRELNYKLVAEVDKLRKENAEISELKKKCTEIETENIELKAENMKVKADNAKLKQTLKEHEIRITNLEQRDKEKTVTNVSQQAERRDEFLSLQLISDLSTVNSNNIPVSSEDKTIDEFRKSIPELNFSYFNISRAKSCKRKRKMPRNFRHELT